MRELKEETGIEWNITKEDSKHEQYEPIGGVIFDNHIYHINVGDTQV